VTCPVFSFPSFLECHGTGRTTTTEVAQGEQALPVRELSFTTRPNLQNFSSSITSSNPSNLGATIDPQRRSSSRPPPCNWPRHPRLPLVNPSLILHILNSLFPPQELPLCKKRGKPLSELDLVRTSRSAPHCSDQLSENDSLRRIACLPKWKPRSLHTRSGLL
jgi:hypothetical protein